MKSPSALYLTLYGSQGSRSPLCNWAAYELSLELTMAKDMSMNPHPFGQIPCLVDDDDIMVFESGAILLYLNSLSASNSKAQEAAIYSWVSWANASLDPICFLETPEGKVYDTGLKKPNKKMKILNDYLSKTDYLVDNKFTVADVAVASYLAYVLQFFPGITGLKQKWPHVCTYLTKCVARPAYAQAFGEPVQQYLLQALKEMDKDVLNEEGDDGKKKLFGMF